jgi:ribosome recycling factor
MLEDLKKDARERMAKCVATFQGDLKKLRTGRAHPSLVEHLKVDYYGSEVPLQQVASIAVEDGRTLVISPWEKSARSPRCCATMPRTRALPCATCGAM